jgi:hypothetical protein
MALDLIIGLVSPVSPSRPHGGPEASNHTPLPGDVLPSMPDDHEALAPTTGGESLSDMDRMAPAGATERV